MYVFFPHSPSLLHHVTLWVATFYIRCPSTSTVDVDPSYFKIHIRSHAQRAISPCACDIILHSSIPSVHSIDLLTKPEQIVSVMRYYHYQASMFHVWIGCILPTKILRCFALLTWYQRTSIALPIQTDFLLIVSPIVSLLPRCHISLLLSQCVLCSEKTSYWLIICRIFSHLMLFRDISAGWNAGDNLSQPDSPSMW
jgi:hypothetical protein